MKRPAKIFLISIGTIVGLIIVVWLGIATYVTVNKKELLQKITLEINESISGKLTVESMEPSLIRGFPGVAVLLKNVSLRDSLYHVHKHDLLRASEVFVSVNPFSLLLGETNLQAVTIREGEIYLYTDSAGYKNTQLFKPGKEGDDGHPKRKIHQVVLENVKFTMDNVVKEKLFSFSFAQLNTKINYYPGRWVAKTKIRTRINSLAFRKSKGSFIEGKFLRTNLRVEYRHKDHILSIPLQDAFFDKDKLQLGGKFSFDPESKAFSLQIKAGQLSYNNALSLLTKRIAGKLRAYAIDKPFSVDARINGSLKPGSIPLVNVNWVVSNSKVSFPGDYITNCSFRGSFINEVKKGVIRRDPNSAVRFYGIRGNWRGIDFRSDTLQVINLKDPVLEGWFISSYALTQINKVSGSESFSFTKGKADLRLWYRAPMKASSRIKSSLRGYLNIRNGSLNYYPRNIRFDDINGTIRFNGPDLFMKDFKVRAGKSRFDMDGKILNFANFYYTDPARITIDWNVFSPRLELREFVAFLGARRQVSKRYAKNRIGRFFMQLNRVLDEASVHLELTANEVFYKRFYATNAHANINLNQSELLLRDLSFRHAGGTLNVSGRAEQKQASSNSLFLVSKLDRVDISRLFYSFDDFGQSSLTSKNIKGKFSALVNVKGRLDPQGTIVSRSFAGKVNFNLKDAALINFEPMEKVGRFAFPNRNFSNIRIDALSNTLGVEGNKIYIPEMTVMTSVLNVVVAGVYGFPKGTNIALQIPLRNPEKDKDLSDSLKEQRVKRGIVINLTAIDDENGQLKIKLGRKDSEDEKKKEDKRKARAEKKKENAKSDVPDER